MNIPETEATDAIYTSDVPADTAMSIGENEAVIMEVEKAPVATRAPRRRCKGCGKNLSNKIFNRQRATRCSKCRKSVNPRVRNKRVTTLRRRNIVIHRQVLGLIRAEEKRLKPMLAELRKDLIGKDYAAAVAAAQTRGTTVRVFRRDGVDQTLAPGINLNRLNVALANGQIEEVLLG